MKHKVAELDGALLDAAVAKAEGRPNPDFIVEGHGDFERVWAPSYVWADGGPIIERVGIDLEWAPNHGAAWFEPDGHTWKAYAPTRDGVNEWTGSTPLIAAMRAFVASKFGDEVDLP